MFLHIGENNLIKSKDVIGIFDIKSLKSSSDNKNFFDKIDKDVEDKKTVIVTDKGEVLSNILVSTMSKRLNKSI